MGAATRQSHLHRRGNIYYCRIALPKYLAAIVGHSEFKKSLKTTDIRVARLLCRELSNRVEAFFIMVNAMRPRDEDIKSLARGYFEHCLAEGEHTLTVETITSRSAWNVAGYDPNDITESIAVSRQRLRELDDLSRRHDFTQKEESLAMRLLSAKGFETTLQNEQLAELCIGIVRAEREAERIKLSHFTANHAEGEIKDPYFSGCRNYFHEPDPEYLIRKQAEHGLEVVKAPQTLDEAIEAYFEDQRTKARGKYSLKQEKRVRKFLERLTDIFGPSRPIASLTVKDGKLVEDVIYRLPVHYVRDHKKNGKTIQTVIQEDGEKLDVRTIKSYLINHKRFFRWCRQKHYIPLDIMEEIELPPEKSDYEDDRHPFSMEQLQTLFASPVYTGRANAVRSQWKASEKGAVRRDGNFWLPLIALHTGMRMSEILYLQPADVRCENGIWILDINKDENGEGAKNNQSVRIVPVHPTLIELGFAEYVQGRIRSIGPRDCVFAEGITIPENQPITKNYSRNFSNYTVKTGVRQEKDNREVFHSFRHNFHDAMDNAGIPNVVTCWITGHKPPKETQTTGDRVYLHNKPPIAKLYEAISKIDYGLDLSHLKPGS